MFGILVVLRKHEDNLGRRRRPKFLFYFIFIVVKTIWAAEDGAPLEDEGNAAGGGCFASSCNLFFIFFYLGFS